MQGTQQTVSILKAVTTKSDIPECADEYYRSLITRNAHFVDEQAQAALRNLKVLVAGCGTSGGACIQPLARLGVTRFYLTDNGSYELSNFNRQHANVDNLGVNKSTFHKGEVLGINPYCEVRDFPDGITPENCLDLVKWADIVLDCVDVTALPAIQMKLLLHECAKEEKKPTLSALDLGFRQWGTTFDYRRPGVKVLNGKIQACRKAKHPIKALFTMFPLDSVPDHVLPLVYDLLLDGERPASQLGCPSDVLSGIIAAALVRYVKTGELISGWNIDLGSVAFPLKERMKMSFKGFTLRQRTKHLLRSTP